METEGTLEKKLMFVEKMDYDIPLGSEMTRKLLITNLSQSSRICVLVEYESSGENRSIMLTNLSNDNSKRLNLFTKHNFQTIESNGSHHEFIKPYSDHVFVTIFVIGNVNINGNDDTTERKTEDGFNIELYDRYETKEDYLYFENDRLNRFIDLRLKCDLNGKHYLVQSRTNDSGKCKNCDNIAISGYNEYSFVCRRCKYELCQYCCHKKVIEKYTSDHGINDVATNSLDANRDNQSNNNGIKEHKDNGQ